MAKMGRPSVMGKIDKNKFETACKCGRPGEEIAYVLGVSVDTMERWVKKTYKKTFAVQRDIFYGETKLNLVALSLKKAFEGSVKMLDVNLQQHCGYRSAGSFDITTANTNFNLAYSLDPKKEPVDT